VAVSSQILKNGGPNHWAAMFRFSEEELRKDHGLKLTVTPKTNVASREPGASQ
jgi:hypothetical protein